jgi:hypothetical protein
VAVPPAMKGQRARCRVCGGELPEPPEGDLAVVRCEYCQADNLADPALIQSLASKQAVVLEHHERALRRNATLLMTEPRMAGFAVAALPLVLYGMMALCMGGLVLIQPLMHREPDSPVPRDYVVIENTPHGACVGSYMAGGDSWDPYLFLDGELSQPTPDSQGVPTTTTTLSEDIPGAPMVVEDFVGMQVHCVGDGPAGTVVQVYGKSAWGGGAMNWVALETDSGREKSCPLLQVCFDQIPANAVVVRWPDGVGN